MSGLKALLWDVDGTLAETERDGHRIAFNQAFEDNGLTWRWSEERYGELLRITGGRERLLHDMATRSDAPVLVGDREALARALHARKNEIYAELVGSAQVPLRDGVVELLRECRSRGVLMGIATTTSRSNVAALMAVHLGADWAEWFKVVVCGEDVQAKKPDPEVYLLALQGLRLGPLDVAALEDSPGGVAAARAAGIPVLVTLSSYFSDASFEDLIAIGPGLHTRAGWRPAPAAAAAASGDARIGLSDIEHWHERMSSVSYYS